MEISRFTLLFIIISSFLFAPVFVRADDTPWGPRVIKLEDVTISCDAYNNYYRDIVEDAAKNNSPKWNAAAKSRLDEAFGTYVTAWIKNSDWIIDMYGKKLPTHKDIKDIECYSSYKDDYGSNYDHTSGNKPGKTLYYKKRTVTKKIRLGYVDDCKIQVVQDIWPDLDKCGTGTIIRNFTIGVWCGNSDFTLKLSQKIHVVPSCSFSPSSLYVPDVQWMCAPIKYEDNDHIKLPDYIKPVTLYNGWDGSCGSSKIYSSYTDRMYRLIQEHRKYVIIRTWVFSDYCSGKTISADQKIMVDGLCRDDEPDKPDEPGEPGQPNDDTVQFTLLNSLRDLNISQETYDDTYKDIVELSLKMYRDGNTDISADLLNAIFGKYEIQPDTTKIDSFNVYTMNCKNGIPLDSTYNVKNGVIQSDCPEKLTIAQKLSSEFTECGLSGLVREFIITSRCDTVTKSDTFTQRILFSPSCSLSEALFEVPADTVVCGTLEKDTLGRIKLPVDSKPVYKGSEPRSFEVAYKFLISYSSEEPARTNVSRIWTYTDTCLNESTMLTQQLTLMDTCSSALEEALKREIVRKVDKENIQIGISPELSASLSGVGQESRSSGNELKTQAYPNPFSESVGVKFHREISGLVTLRIIDTHGRYISQEEYELDKGDHILYIGSDRFKTPGMYVLQIVTAESIENIRVLYQKQ